MMTMTGPATRPQELTLFALFAKFLRFGTLAFGGPVAQIAMLRQALVDEELWIDPARFNRLLAVLQVLPGPEAHELCVHFGMIARGRVGGLLAGLAFMLPGLMLMLLAGWAYVEWIARDVMLAKALLSVQIVVLAIILRAVFKIGRHIILDRPLAAIALASLIATLFDVPFWISLAAGGAIYAAATRPLLLGVITAFALGLALATHFVTATVGIVPTRDPITLAALFVAGLKGGLLTFGGAYTAIPYVRADTVGRGWIGDAGFLDGLALAGVLPAPLVIFVTFVGYVAAGLGGALAITAGMFLPAFAFSLIFFERLEAVVENVALHRLLAGIAAAVVGIIGATFVQLSFTTTGRIVEPCSAALLFLAAFAGAWLLKGSWVTPAMVLAGAMAGWLIA